MIQYDFNFHSDSTNKIISVILGFLIYSATLAVVSCIFTIKLTNNWQSSLVGKASIEFPPAFDTLDHELTEKQNDQVMQILRSYPEITNVRRLKESDILSILEPWLQNTAIPDDFPFPTLYDISYESKLNLLELSSKLSRINSSVKIHDHASWFSTLSKICKGLFGFSILLSFLIFFTVAASIVFIMKKTLSAHQDVVSILQVIGANNSYIARQFRSYCLEKGLHASLLSVLLTVATIAAVSYFSTERFFLESHVAFIPAILGVPLIAILLIAITSNRSVIFFLRRASA